MLRLWEMCARAQSAFYNLQAASRSFCHPLKILRYLELRFYQVSPEKQAHMRAAVSDLLAHMQDGLTAQSKETFTRKLYTFSLSQNLQVSAEDAVLRLPR